ncbi:hypothetical protein B9C57_03105 [Tenacibaculum maritimum]|nr:hypothetical protein B9C57_03105 [Tenacibaculum maritimum]
MLTLLYMVCCVFQAPNLVNNYRPRKSARAFASWQEASNKLYTVLPNVFLISSGVFIIVLFILDVVDFQNAEVKLR